MTSTVAPVLPAPFYDQDGITLYCGDCREILPLLESESVDLVLTDPPYGVSYVLKPRISGKGHRRIPSGGKPAIFGDDKPFEPSHLFRFKRLILFGANHYSDQLPVSGGWIVWDKSGGGRGSKTDFSEVELAWSNVCNTPKIKHHLWKGLTRDSEAGQRVLHPTQKPVELMTWMLEQFSKPNDLILDPYSGSGPILVAAKLLNRRAIGIEISEEYCAIAVQRLAQGCLTL